MRTTTCAAGATGPVRFHADDGQGNPACGVPISMSDVIALGYDKPTCPTCVVLTTRLVQSRHRDGDMLALRVDIEGVEAPKLSDITVTGEVTVRGALLPRRRYALLGEWFVVTIQQTDDGVRVELHVRAEAARCGFVLSLAWAGLLEQEIAVDVPWWPAVVACQWDGEGDVEVAA